MNHNLYPVVEDEINCGYRPQIYWEITRPVPIADWFNGLQLKDEGRWEWLHPFSSRNPHAHHWKNRRGKR